MRAILKCGKCGRFKLKEKCCEVTKPILPPKFSLDDKYASYRREAKLEERKERDLL